MTDEIVVEADPKVSPIVTEAEPVVTEPAVTPIPKTYTQEDLDRITAKVKKNARYQTRKEVEAFYKGRDSSPERREAKPNEEIKPPERGDFDSYEEFLDAKAAFTGGKAAREERLNSEREAAERKSVEANRKIFNDFQSKVIEKYPDIEERLEAISDTVMPAVVLQAIAESEQGPDILSHLADNPKDCERIAALSPSAAIREIGKLEAKLEAKKDVTASKPIIASKAPAPIVPGGGGNPPDDVPMDTDTVDEWIRKERARERKKTGT